ncbi:lipase family protein [Dyadobacter sp. CY323]|uniref:lipase family protein n=1 Tax=Dyadobacter sp. CY323 TaxID=2907302 RepID=UPI001F43D053|nr:lipase family protein [Dyadobacter sp. CY323]MCE6991664.1 lipase family protein [Dyadobacter sp. CY323]
MRTILIVTNLYRSLRDSSSQSTLLFMLLLVILASNASNAQKNNLKPGFDKVEYMELMYMHSLIYDSTKADPNKPRFVSPKPAHFKSIYRSPVIGMENRWELWKDERSVVAINVRGTTQAPVSWMQNFYAAMVPAKGALKLSNSFTFNYNLAENPRAGVHVGWLVGMAFLAKDIVPKIDSCYKAGSREFLVMGHSQGGGIVYLLTSHLYSLQKQGILPKDIRFKTYASAAPKAGNTYYAYEYEHLVDGGWGYNVVNSADWVPEVPFTSQSLTDFNNTNPFKNIDSIVGKQKLIARVALRHAYRKMKKPSIKAQKNYEKYLGGYASKAVKKVLPEFEPPVYMKSSNFVRIGPTIMLLADDDYYKLFPDSDENPFAHHLPQQYLYLIDKYQK